MIGSKPARGSAYRLNRELVYAMESARSRLVVAMAMENKTTPRERWRSYLETEDRMRRCLREIRCPDRRNPGGHLDWLEALSLLKQSLPATEGENSGGAQIMCRRMLEVLEILERSSAA